MLYKNEQKKRGEKLIQGGFFGDNAGHGKFRRIPRPFVLKDGKNNLYPDVRDDVLDYFKQNNIVWWGGKSPTGHVLSSQIACLNHLFPIRQDKVAVLNLLKSITDDFIDVFPIAENMPGYIQFEAVGGVTNYLNEGTNTRGSNCTSVDALIYALHKNGKRFLIPIEWKYVEAYGNEDKSLEDKGKKRKSRYDQLINRSQYLNNKTQSCCWYEPFYQLMRQTLWAEQIIINQVKGLEADDYLHLHVIPDHNTQLLNKTYPYSGKGMEETWRQCLTIPDKYKIISPKQLWSKQNASTPLFQYIQQRYW
ncbi:hypothetical protein AAC978_07640 [Desulfitobacterium sp. THU1]|uniref:PGN_0703 family putative restriction endonuclease n=1 Tax=Desulfitobacterium sp. THU1 TaxID=3138072 RepID=UPI00311DBA06